MTQEFDTDYTDRPTCPYCGYVINNEGDYDSGFYTEDEFEFDCPSCDQPVRSQAYISFSYTTTKIDREAEAIEKAAKEAKEKERIDKRYAACKEWLPGTRIRIRTDSRYADWLRGRVGVVSDREICKHNPFVEVDLDEHETYKGYKTFFFPEDLERI